MATLADVAAAAGVSKATASRALSRRGAVADGTTVRVQAAAARLKYFPNRAAQELARGRSGIVALLVPTLDNPFFTPIISGAQACAAGADLQLTVAVHPLDTDAELQALARLAAQVDGLLLAAPRGSDAQVSRAAALKPAVLLDRELDGLDSVVADTASAFGELVSELVAAGHRRIIYLGGPEGSWQNLQRTAAVRAATAGKAELTVLGPFPSTFAAGVQATEAILRDGASAVVPYATTIGLGVMFTLRARGVDCPGEVLVTAESMIADALGPDAVPAIDVDGEALGHAAMSRLVAVLAGTPTPADQAQLRLPVAVRWPRSM